MSFAMLISMIILPILNTKYEKKRRKIKEEKRQIKYKEYIEGKIVEIDEEMFKQRSILLKNYVSVEECTKIILSKDVRLWERKSDDYDFLEVRLGIGEVPLDADINYPDEKFVMEEDNLKEILREVLNKSKTMEGAPIVYSLSKKNISAIISDNIELAQNMMKNIIIQLITFHNYEDLKLVFLLNEDKKRKWEFAKKLPYVWDSSKKIRFFADNDNDYEIVSRYLEEELKSKIEENEKNKENNFKNLNPYYLIIVEDYKKVENLKIIKEILAKKENVGFGIICMTENLLLLPNEVQSFIVLQEKEGMILEREITESNQIKFTFNFPNRYNFDEISTMLFNIPIKARKSKKKEEVIENVSFLDLYEVRFNRRIKCIRKMEKK